MITVLTNFIINKKRRKFTILNLCYNIELQKQKSLFNNFLINNYTLYI